MDNPEQMKLEITQMRAITIGFVLFISASLSACNSGSSANGNNSKQIAAIQAIVNQNFESYSATQGFTAIGVTVQCNGVNNSQPITVYAGTMGYQNIDPRPVNDNAIWQIGSNSKSFATVTLLQLASDSQYNFSLDDPITKWLPQYEYYNWGDQIPTIRQIMHMTSGIPDDISMDWVNWYLNNLYVYLSPQDMITNFAHNTLAFQPGTAWSYSNTGYQILGLLIEKITGNSASSEITKRVIIPAGLQNTYFVDNLPTDVVDGSQLMHGYYYTSESTIELENGIDTSQTSLSGEFFIAGNVISTPNDMNKYYRILFTTNTLLNAEQLEELTSLVSWDTGQPISYPSEATQSFEGFGLGIIAIDLKGQAQLYPDIFQPYPNITANLNKYSLIYGYDGGNLGFEFYNYYNPANNSSVVVTVNGLMLTEHATAIRPTLFSILNYLEPLCK